jgi:hypothetical protein
MATVEQLKNAKSKKSGSKRTKLNPDRWDDWVKHLAKREKPVALAKLIAAKKATPLLWALPASVRDTDAEELVVRLQEKRLRRVSGKGAKEFADIAGTLEQWLDTAQSRPASDAFAMEALAWCHALPALSGLLPAAPWSQLVDQLMSIATEAHCVSTTSPLTQQLLAGELPLTLAYLMPELRECKDLAIPAREVLSSGLTELLDGEGMPQANHLPISRSLFACWTRCHYLGRTMKHGCYSKDANTQYEWFVRQMMRLCRSDGTQVLSSDASGEWSPALFDAALILAGDVDDDEIAQCILPSRKDPAEPRAALPRAAANSEWAELAVLRRGWNRASDQLMLQYSNREVQLELNCGGETVFSGVCNPELQVDGDRLELEDDWEEICWHSDHDLDYVEIEGRYPGGWKVQRQLMLTRDDRFLLIADAVFGEATSDIVHQFTLPLRSGITFSPAEETREGILHGRKPIGAVLPLQLPEWRTERDGGSLEETADGLRLRQQTRGQRLFAPLLIDLKPKRFSRQLTWRRLTVARHLEIMPADVAVGYRIQSGKRQWLMYRSLAPTASRSILGQHFSSEFVVARFKEEGELEQLLETE